MLVLVGQLLAEKDASFNHKTVTLSELSKGPRHDLACMVTSVLAIQKKSSGNQRPLAQY